MVRPSQLLHPPRTPAPLRPAATLLLLRDAAGGQGIEVLMTRRSPHARFAPDVWVFPGGGVEAADSAAHASVARRPGQNDAALTDAVAALRECFEEVGILLARHADGRWATDADLARINRQASTTPLAAQCAAHGLTLSADAVWPFAHWTGALDLPWRFDTAVTVACMPPGQTPVADDVEQFEPRWLRPADALAEGAAGTLLLLFPTLHTLQRLATFDQVADALAAVTNERPLFASMPRGALRGGQSVRLMETDPAYGELALVCPDGQTSHVLDWQSTHAVPLARTVLRLTAPNPGRMTGPGTNSYLVGTAASGYIAIDPGPAHAEHIARLHAAAGGDVRMIVCTHSHADHAPGAWLLQALCGNRPAVLGLPSAPTAAPQHAFAPDRALLNGELLALVEPGQEHDLMVVFTPGHAANHLCLVLLQDGLLFSGDHILNGATPVIDPPDGHMGDYLQSLEVLATACATCDVDFILPAHGHVLHDAPGVIARLKAHRLAREAKVAAALAALPDGSPSDWVRHAYSDIPPAMWPLAERSLIAHVERLRTAI